MNDGDLVKNTISLFPATDAVEKFRHFFGGLRFEEDVAWTLLAQLIRRNNYRATMEIILDGFVDEAMRIRQSQRNVRDEEPTKSLAREPARYIQILSSAPPAQSSADADKHVCVDGVLIKRSYFCNRGVFDFMKQFECPEVKLCSHYPNCDKGNECGFGHMKLHKDSNHPLYGVPIYVNIEGEFIETIKLKRTACLDLLRQKPHYRIELCKHYPKCPHKERCNFAHYNPQ